MRWLRALFQGRHLQTIIQAVERNYVWRCGPALLPRKGDGRQHTSPLLVVAVEDMWGTLVDVHCQLSHRGRQGMENKQEQKEEWMRANRRQSLTELCNLKLVRLAQVPHRTADRDDPKLVSRKWQPPHNMANPKQ